MIVKYVTLVYKKKCNWCSRPLLDSCNGGLVDFGDIIIQSVC